MIVTSPQPLRVALAWFSHPPTGITFSASFAPGGPGGCGNRSRPVLSRGVRTTGVNSASAEQGAVLPGRLEVDRRKRHPATVQGVGADRDLEV